MAVEEYEKYDEYDYSLLGHNSEINLVKMLAQLPNTIRGAAEKRRPHLLAKYAQQLAYSFNQFYRDCPVLKADGELRALRLELVKATRIALHNILDCLGIVAPEEM